MHEALMIAAFYIGAWGGLGLLFYGLIKMP